MKIRSIIICTFITMFVTSLAFVMGVLEDRSQEAKEVYQVYLDGKKLGAIADADELYTLINKEQSDIKSTYNVDNVYPPNGFNITKDITYENNIDNVKKVYDEIKEEKPFTIK